MSHYLGYLSSISSTIDPKAFLSLAYFDKGGCVYTWSTEASPECGIVWAVSISDIAALAWVLLGCLHKKLNCKSALTVVLFNVDLALQSSLPAPIAYSYYFRHVFKRDISHLAGILAKDPEVARGWLENFEVCVFQKGCQFAEYIKPVPFVATSN